MIPGRLTRRYARALLAIGVETSRFEPFGAQLERFSSLWSEHRDLRPTLENPSHALARRQAVLRGIARKLELDDTVQNFLLLLLDKGRLQLIDPIARDYRRLADQHAGRVRAYVTSARQLDRESMRQLQAALEGHTGMNVLISADVQPDLLAGTRTRIGTTVYDGSLSTRLEQLRQTMLTGRL